MMFLLFNFCFQISTLRCKFVLSLLLFPANTSLFSLLSFLFSRSSSLFSFLFPLSSPLLSFLSSRFSSLSPFVLFLFPLSSSRSSSLSSLIPFLTPLLTLLFCHSLASRLRELRFYSCPREHLRFYALNMIMKTEL